MKSLRAHLLTGVIGAITVLVCLFSILLYVSIRAQWIHQFNQALLSTAHILAVSAEVDGQRVDMELRIEEIPEFNNPRQPMYYQIWRNGVSVAKSPLLGKRDLALIKGTFSEPAFGTQAGPDGSTEHAVGFCFVPRVERGRQDGDRPEAAVPAAPVDLVVARNATEQYRQLSILGTTLALTLGLILCLSVGSATIVINRGLRPLTALATEIGGVTEVNLSDRIGATHVPTELIPIVERLNGLLQRLHTAFQREKRFTADVTHELRTPLAGLRSALEVTLSRPRETREYRTAMSDCLAIVKSMQTMSENLLRLARTESGQAPLRISCLHVGQTVDACWSRLADTAFDRGMTFENQISPTLTVQADETCLNMILTNVLDNAITYGEEGERIWMCAQQNETHIELSLSNTGCKLTPSQLGQMFDAFWRADAARTDATVHCGLGLAVVQRLVHILGGSVSARSEQEIFEIRISLPTLFDV